jgi:poly(A) polymerase
MFFLEAVGKMTEGYSIDDAADALQESMKAQAAIDVIARAIKGSKWEGRLFIAGGYVRDMLLRRDAKDVDIVAEGGITAGMDAATFLARKLGVYKKGSNPVLFPKFGTAKVTLRDGTDIEFVAPRKEKYDRYTRKPIVSPGTMRDDAFRRDLTINSLMQNLTTKEIKDLTGLGLRDLKAGVVRTPVDPDIIFKEDPLRMLRAIRFTFKYNFKMPFSMVKAIRKNARMLTTHKKVSNERIRDELDKMLVLERPSKVLRLLKVTGLLPLILPEVQALVGVKQNKYHDRDVFGHVTRVLDRTPPDIITRLGALFHDIGKVATRIERPDGKVQFIGHADVGEKITAEIMRRLKYSTRDIRQVTTLVGRHMDLKHGGPEAIHLKDKHLRKFVHKVADLLEPALDLINADNISHAAGHSMPDQIAIVRKRIRTWDLSKYIKPQLEVDGTDIAALGAEGRLIGKIMARILEKHLEHDGFSRKDALQLAMHMIKDHKKTRRRG